MKAIVVCFVAILSLALAQRVPAADTPASAYFDQHIAPLLAEHCLDCHSGKKPKGGLDLSQRGTAYKGESGDVIVPGKLADSLLWENVSNGDMPPKHPLSKEKVALIKTWIEKGAAWGEKATIERFAVTTSKRAGYDWWSLQPLSKPAVPTVKAMDRVRTPVDAFVIAKLEAKDLSYSPDADARTLIRRAYFDLIGMPPTPEEVEAFVKEMAAEAEAGDRKPEAVKGNANTADGQPPTAYARLIDRLLASPHYGERWGRHWLDVARFGESNGFELNDPRYNAWHYRDWVVRALNDDMPFDQFARMQIAGDVIAKDSYEGMSASGLLVAGVHNTIVGSSPTMKRLAREDELEEIVGMVGQTFLGLTLNCARCHDHKFDPISQEEYYRFTALLAGVTHGERKVKRATDQAKIDAMTSNLDAITKQIIAIETPAREAELAARAKGAAEKPESPRALARWEFDTDLRDSLGELHGTATGGAKLENGALVVDGKGAFVTTAALKKDITAKTLEAWVQLDSLDQRGGGVISLQTTDGIGFDAIVFGEREPKRWMAGSDFFRRTHPFGGDEEREAGGKPVHIAFVYDADGTITAYRQGQPYGKPYKSGGVVTFKAGASQVIFGLRHGTGAAGGRMLAGRIERAQLYDRALTADEVAASAGVETSFVFEDQLVARLTPELRKKREQLKRDQQQTQQELDAVRRAAAEQSIYTIVPKNPAPTRLLYRGSVTDEGPVIDPGASDCIKGVPGDLKLAANASDADRRKALAAWITDRNNALFARVIVNRLWKYHFGTGIVETPSDFGYNGGRPSHPELLDYLAQELINNGYRLKPLHRLIMMSSAYRQAGGRDQGTERPSDRGRDNPQSAIRNPQSIDANNRLLWRFSPHRLEGEVVRDAMLKVAGRLDDRLGGAPFVDVKITRISNSNYYESFDREDPAFNRRTLYRLSIRGGRSALLDTFDCPDPSATAPRRSVTTTPLQALSLLNNAFVLRMADHLAARVRKETGDDFAKQVDRAFALVLQRKPDEVEREAGIALVEKHGLSTLARALFNSNEFVIAE